MTRRQFQNGLGCRREPPALEEPLHAYRVSLGVSAFLKVQLSLCSRTRRDQEHELEFCLSRSFSVLSSLPCKQLQARSKHCLVINAIPFIIGKLVLGLSQPLEAEHSMHFGISCHLSILLLVFALFLSVEYHSIVATGKCFPFQVDFPKRNFLRGSECVCLQEMELTLHFQIR